MEVKHLACAKGHSERIWSVAWSPVDDIFATCSSDCSVRIWRLQRRKEPDTSMAHHCASSDSDCLKEYDITLQASIDKYFKKTIRSVRFNNTGEFLICASFDGTSSVWTPSTQHAKAEPCSSDSFPESCCSGEIPWKCVAVLEGHENEVKCAAFDCTSTFIATCGRDKSVWIYQRSQFTSNDSNDIARFPRGHLGDSIEYFCAAILTGHSQDVKSVCWSPNALVLASASYDNSVRIWGLSRDDWACVQVLNLHSSTVWSISFSLDGDKLVSVSADCAVAVYKSAKSKEYLDALNALHQQVPSTSSILKVGLIDSTISHDIVRKTQKLNEYRLKNPLIADDWQPCHFIQSYHSRAIYSVDMHSLILTGGGDNMVRIMSPEEDGAKSKYSFKAHSSDVNGVAWKPNDPSMVFATVGDDEYIKVWKVTL
ncbi:hypothetical protein BgAZ_101400 [Babesia gibsoni]|uniref:Probable cytosolic iron-sulfur protein assembly protein CIAO1 homolog n=1 Tax=Babesia gibsoni TaxID=33632 RepID=A0AAD8PFA3_BABGI|nr:hypothetical protein BgAZ_101400 [Babesia gibsoni]